MKARCTIEGGKPGYMNGVLDAGRHLDLKWLYFQQPDFLKKARLVKVSEQDHVADACTKPLPLDVLNECKKALGLYGLHEDGRLSAVVRVSWAAMAVAKRTSRAFAVFALSALLTPSVRAADSVPTPVAVGFGAFDMLIAIFVSMTVGFLVGRLRYRRPQASSQDGGNYADLTAEKAAFAKIMRRRICKICWLQR